MRVRNPDTRDQLADEFLRTTGADIREGHGEAYYVQSHDFVSMPAFEAFKGADHFYNVAFHELTHNADNRIMPRQGHRPCRYPRTGAPSFGIIREAISDDRFGCLDRSSFHRTKESPRRLRPDTRMSERQKESRDSRVPISP
jgi:hypothetical protein